MNISSVCGTFHQLPWTFCRCAGSSVNFPCVCRNFHRLFMHPWDLPSISVFCRTFPSNFRVTADPSINFPCGHGTFRQLSLCLRNLLSTFVIFPCLCWTLRKLLANFLDSEGTSVNFCQISVGPRDLPSTFPASVGPSVNFPCVHGTCYQPSVRLWNLVSTFCASTGPSVNILWLCRTLGRLPSTFRSASWLSVKFPCVRGTCQRCSTSLYYLVVQAVQQSFLYSISLNTSVVQVVRLGWTTLNHELFLYHFFFHLLGYSSISAGLHARNSWNILRFLFSQLHGSSSSSAWFINHTHKGHYPMILVLLITR